MEKVVLKNAIQKPISGEWGTEPENGDGIQVIRSTNFTNEGHLDLSNVVVRKIPESKVAKKRLVYGDTILEKSGGSPKQPVGRVVYFDLNAEDGLFLCNNFTSVIRPKKSVDSRYLFWFLFGCHRFGFTQKFQNKTTGIINLKLDQYLSSVEIPLPPLTEQRRIASQLDQADRLRRLHQAQLSAYDALARSLFLEMFGDPVKNEKGWEVREIGEIVHSIDNGWSPVCEDSRRSFESEWAVLKLGAVTYRNFDPSQHKALKLEDKGRSDIEVQKGDLLFSRKNTYELVGACAYVFDTPANLMLPDTIFRLNYNQEAASPIFLWFLINDKVFRKEIQRLASGSSGSMPNISKGRLLKKEIPLPPLSLQTRFASMIENLEQQKAQMQAAAREAEGLFQGLLQEVFGGGS